MVTEYMAASAFIVLGFSFKQGRREASLKVDGEWSKVQGIMQDSRI